LEGLNRSAVLDYEEFFVWMYLDGLANSIDRLAIQVEDVAAVIIRAPYLV